MTLENNYDIKSLTTPVATGGTITTSGNYRIHTFTSSGTFVANKSMNVDYLVVAGGGGGGKMGGGGGAGGFLTGTGFAVTNQSYNITVGSGGAGATVINTQGSNGTNSVFATITALGGGGGGAYLGNEAGISGGSGGGGSYHSGTGAAGGAGTSGQGNAGGAGASIYSRSGGGGGGASANGANSDGYVSGGIGGAGTASSISGSSVTYAGGGGGSSETVTSGTGGAGGGGRGEFSNHFNADSGTANTGGGGGGGYNNASGNGGSGIVIVRYLSSYDVTATSMTVTPREIPCRTVICTVDVSVTWVNNGPSTSLSDLSITVSGVTSTVTPLSYPSVSFAANGNAGDTITRTFTVSGMTAGTCSICPNPN